MDNNWVDDTHPNGKTIFFDVDGNTFNAWQTVEFYCDQITALGYRLESDYAANLPYIMKALLKTSSLFR